MNTENNQRYTLFMLPNGSWFYTEGNLPVRMKYRTAVIVETMNGNMFNTVKRNHLVSEKIVEEAKLAFVSGKLAFLGDKIPQVFKMRVPVPQDENSISDNNLSYANENTLIEVISGKYTYQDLVKCQLDTFGPPTDPNVIESRANSEKAIAARIQAQHDERAAKDARIKSEHGSSYRTPIPALLDF